MKNFSRNWTSGRKPARRDSVARSSSMACERCRGHNYCFRPNSEAPGERHPVITRAAIVLWCDQRKEFRAAARFFLITRIPLCPMMRAIDITADAVPRGTADQNIREIMLAASEPRETYGTGNAVSADLHPAMIVVFVSDHRGQRPGLNAMA